MVRVITKGKDGFYNKAVYLKLKIGLIFSPPTLPEPHPTSITFQNTL